MQRESQEQQLGFSCAIISMFGFAITMGMFFVLLAMLALWVKAQPNTPTYITIVVTNTPQAPLTNTPAQVALIIPTDTPAPTPLPTIAPTNTPLPTDTPFPTSTPLPTNEILPTVTPTDSPTVTSQPITLDVLNDSVGKTYIGNIAEISNLMADGSKLLSTRLSEGLTDPTVIFTEEWKTDIVLALVKLKVGSESIRKLLPPPYLINMNNDLVEAANHIDNAINLLSEGLDHLDSAKVIEGSREFQLAIELIDSSKEKLKSLTGQ